jgi:hypothetical protein
MTPKEKATELVDNFSDLAKKHGEPTTYEFDKQCALIAVDEIINCDSYFKKLDDSKEFTKYWYEVQQEIQKL